MSLGEKTAQNPKQVQIMLYTITNTYYKMICIVSGYLCQGFTIHFFSENQTGEPFGEQTVESFKQEVMYRKGPFFTMNHDETPRSKMLKVKSRTGGIFRPYLGPIEAENICMNELEWLIIKNNYTKLYSINTRWS